MQFLVMIYCSYSQHEYIKGKSTYYISLDGDSGHCDFVDTSFSLQRFVSQNGAWQGITLAHTHEFTFTYMIMWA